MSNIVLRRYPALGFAWYRRYWLASFASVGATQLITLAQAWLVFELSGSALQLGVLGAAAAVPNLLINLIGGVVADRFDKRRILMATSLLTAGLLGILAWLDASDQVRSWHVFAIAATVSLITGLDWPARVSIYPLLVDRSAFMSAVALNSFIWQATRMAIPALGGLLIAAVDTWALFAAGATGFLIMFVAIASIPVKPPRGSPGSALAQIKEGVRFIWHDGLFRSLLGLTFVGMFFTNSYVQIMPVFAELLAAGETGYGYLLSAGGVGSVTGTLLVGAVHRYRRLGGMMLAGAAGSALLLAGFAAAATYGGFVAALALAFLASVCASAFMITSMTVMQLKVPDDLRGRVMGIHTMGFGLMPLGGLFLGTLAEAASPLAALWLGAGIHLCAIAWVASSQTKVRSLDGRHLESAG